MKKKMVTMTRMMERKSPKVRKEKKAPMGRRNPRVMAKRERMEKRKLINQKEWKVKTVTAKKKQRVQKKQKAKMLSPSQKARATKRLKKKETPMQKKKRMKTARKSLRARTLGRTLRKEQNLLKITKLKKMMIENHNKIIKL